MKKTTTDTRCTVLCPLGLHRSVKMLAAYRGQSMNKTIIDLLEQGPREVATLPSRCSAWAICWLETTSGAGRVW